jgi:hypothetical protein
LRQFVAWRWELRDGRWTKVLIEPRTGQRARANAPGTWGTFAEAVACAQRRRLPGISIVLTEQLGVVGGDVDHCRVRETGELSALAEGIRSRLDTATWVSTTGTGLRWFVRARFPEWFVASMTGKKTGRRDTARGVEVYSTGRHLTLTTVRVPGTSEEIEPRQAELDALLLELFPPKPAAAPTGPATGVTGFDDAEVLRRCESGKHAERFRRLFLYGDASDYPGPDGRPNLSSADLGLCNLLRYYSGDRAQVERLWGRSALAQRSKWQRADYRAMTLDEAMMGDVYTPPLTIDLEDADARTNGHASPPPRPPEDESPPVTLAELVAVFRRWLFLDDDGPVYAVLAAVAANLMVGDPLWLMLVGPSSGGKTELLNAVTGLPHVHAAATLTEGALLSGTPKREKDKASKGGLLREIGPFGILAIKDFTSILSMNRDPRAQLLAALREIYDGAWTRHVGVDGGRTLSWQGKLGLVAGCTAAIDSFHAVMATMGERFLLYRLPAIDPQEQATRALGNTGREREMRAALAGAVAGLFRGLRLPDAPPELDAGEREGLVALASLTARGRSAVERDPHTREIELILDPEAPARLAQSLRRLYGGLLAIGLDRPRAWAHVVKVGLDCLPKVRRGVFGILADAGGGICTSTTEVAEALGYPTTTTRRALEDLTVHGVATRIIAPKGGADQWRLTDWAWARYRATVPETAGTP